MSTLRACATCNNDAARYTRFTASSSVLLRSWQKPRFLPAETKLMSEKAPQATFSNKLGTSRAQALPAGGRRGAAGERESNANAGPLRRGFGILQHGLIPPLRQRFGGCRIENSRRVGCVHGDVPDVPAFQHREIEFHPPFGLVRLGFRGVERLHRLYEFEVIVGDEIREERPLVDRPFELPRYGAGFSRGISHGGCFGQPVVCRVVLFEIECAAGI